MAAPISSPQTTSNPDGSWGVKYTPPGGYSKYNELTGNSEVYDQNGVKIGQSTAADVAARSNEPIVRSADDPVIKQEVALADKIKASGSPDTNTITTQQTSEVPTGSDSSIVNTDSLDPYARAKALNNTQFDENGQPLAETVTPGTTSKPVANVNLEAPTTTTTTPAPPQTTPTGKDDWRVKLSLAKKADYLYKDANIKSTNILYPLVETDGVIFPYVPEIRVNYKANYNTVDITHTNYKNYFYTNSSVDEVSIQAMFTAQDNLEAKYMLAVIHFFRSVTKMFYGQDTDPRGGTPPPLCFLTGLGSHQFENHPLVIAGFSYNLPNDVDYIRADTSTGYSAGGVPIQKSQKPPQKSNIFSRFLSSHRLGSANLNKQAKPAQPNFNSITFGESSVTYVPSKLQINLQCLPIVSRANVSNKFKLNGKDGYGSGELITKGFW